MNKNIAKIVISMFILITLLFFNSCNSILHSIFSVSSINYGKNSFSFSDYGFILLEGEYLFDTGAQGTLIIKNDSLDIEFTEKDGLSYNVKDSKGAISTENMYYFEKFPINNIQFNEAYMAMVPSESLSPEVKIVIQKGVIGMTFIQHANWLINFQDSTILCFPRDSTITIPDNNIMTLKYKKTLRPEVDLIIDNHKFKRVLFDTGFNGDFSLNKEQISQIEKAEVIEQEHKTFGFYTSEPEINISRIFKELNVNNFVFNDIIIAESNFTPKVGMSFLKRFNNILLDTKNQKIHLYN